MLNLFENETAPLTADELKLVPGFVNALKKCVGVKNAVTSQYIINAYKKIGIKMTGARIRKIINHIRLNSLVPCLMASSKGYYISNDANEFKDYIESLRQRISAIQAVRNVLIEQGKYYGLLKK